MKKHIVVISGILQFIAVVFYAATIKSFIALSNKETDFGTVAFVILIALGAQIASSKLKAKYAKEVEKAEEIMQKPKASYGWLALAIFVAVVIFFIVYVKFFLN